jgi:ubiquinone/menaquinone biosynthesis C-methylase UbiE
MVSAAEKTRERFIWREIQSPEHLGKLRMAAMEQFLEDYPNGLREGRYRVAELPVLPFRDAEFDLALCSHFLFTYSDLFPLEFHVQSVREMCRVANEARIFPLLPNFANDHSPHVAPLMSELSAQGYRCEIVRVPYEFLKGGNEMLRVASPRSALRHC